MEEAFGNELEALRERIYLERLPVVTLVIQRSIHLSFD